VNASKGPDHSKLIPIRRYGKKQKGRIYFAYIVSDVCLTIFYMPEKAGGGRIIPKGMHKSPAVEIRTKTRAIFKCFLLA
jgi:hypothetical protein